MVSEKSLAASAAPLVDVVDIAAIAAGLRKGSAVSGGDSSEGDGAEGGGRNIETPTPFPVSSQIGTGGLSRQNSLRRIEPTTLAAASAQVNIAVCGMVSHSPNFGQDFFASLYDSVVYVSCNRLIV